MTITFLNLTSHDSLLFYVPLTESESALASKKFRLKNEKGKYGWLDKDCALVA
jgi:hypothetical protein